MNNTVVIQVVGGKGSGVFLCGGIGVGLGLTDDHVKGQTDWPALLKFCI